MFVHQNLEILCFFSYFDISIILLVFRTSLRTGQGRFLSLCEIRRGGRENGVCVESLSHCVECSAICGGEEREGDKG